MKTRLSTLLLFILLPSVSFAFSNARHEPNLPLQVVVSPITVSSTLKNEIPKAQARLENHLKDFGTVVNTNPNGEITGDDDSALWTGVYLASQCFQYSVETQEPQRSVVLSRIAETFSSIERLFDVTAVPGLMARFTFNPSASVSQRSAHLGAVDPKLPLYRDAGWRTSKSSAYPGWTWFGATSRDQYSGFFFAMGVCTKYLDPSSKLVSEMKSRAITAITEIRKNGWKIPAGDHNYGKQTLHIIDGDLKLAWGKLVLSLTTDAKLIKDLNSDISNELYKLKARTVAEQKNIPILGITPPEFNNYVEYYGWNLRYLAYYLMFAVPDLKTGIQAEAKTYLIKNMWPYTTSHLNSMFTWIKLSSVGTTDLAKDQTALAEAADSLEQLAVKDRTDKAVKNSDRLGKDLEQDPKARDISKAIDIVKKTPFANDFIKSQTGLDIVGYSKKFNPLVAKNALPIKERPPGDFYWQLNPRALDGGSDKGFEYPGVDLILGYWMGIAHGYLKP